MFSKIGRFRGLRKAHTVGVPVDTTKNNADTTESFVSLEKKPPYIMHPENVPTTIPLGSTYPIDFNRYTFAGAAIEQVSVMGENGESFRRPALVAKMKLEREVDGAKVKEEMTCSLKDLRQYVDPATGIVGHADSEGIASALSMCYAEKIPHNRQEDVFSNNRQYLANNQKKSSIENRLAGNRGAVVNSGSTLFAKLNDPKKMAPTPFT